MSKSNRWKNSQALNKKTMIKPITKCKRVKGDHSPFDFKSIVRENLREF